MSSRRGLLKLGLLLGGTTLVGGGLFYKKVMSTRAMAEQLVYFLDYPELALTVGQGLLKTDPTLHNISLDQMIEKILQSIDVSKEKLPEITRSQLLERLHQRVRNDFENEQIVLVNGWLLSQTEARLCSLLTLIT